MAALLKGQDVILLERVEVGRDNFNFPIYETREETVSNVLITPVSSEDIIQELDLYGKRAVCQLSIPKGDAHEWPGNQVKFNGHTWTVYDFPKEYQDNLTPLDWNNQYYCERTS